MQTVPSYLDLVSYKRPQGSSFQRKFCNRFLWPVFGKPDVHGNFTKIVPAYNGGHPTVAFMAHHDTVHTYGGKQNVVVNGDFFRILDENCLGADCTTGIYIILRMIAAQVPGVYVIHASEEIGCLGSQALVKDMPEWIFNVKAAISLDRKGYEDIITHQLGMRTCSDAFARSLAEVLNGDFKPDPTGVYTDSNEYVDFIPECTNLSVGYFAQHTKGECQDNVFMEQLVDSMIAADWSKLVIERVAGAIEYEYIPKKGKKVNYYLDPLDWNDDYDLEDWKAYGNDNDNSLQSVIERYPEEVASILADYGYTAMGLLDDVEDIAVKNNRPYGRMMK